MAKMVSPSMVSGKAACVLALLLVFQVACLSVTGLDYSYSENTPGTTTRIMNGAGVARNAGAVAAGGAPIPAAHKIPDNGQTIAGAAIDCGAMITQLSAMYRGIGGGAPLADRQGRNVMNRPVIGVAVVDYGAAGLHAYLSRSGLGLAAGASDADAIRLAAAAVGAPLANANQWRLLSPVVASHNIIQAHRDTHMVALPHVGANTEPQDIAAWVPAGGEPEGIHFAMGPTTIAKKWPNGGGWHLDTSSPNNFAGGCAMQKLMGNLYGYNGPLPAFPGGGVRPFLGPNAQNALAAPKLVCAAEAAHGTQIGVLNWAANNQVYAVGDEVASCTACQGYIPEVVTQAAGSCALVAPANGGLGTCGARLRHTGSCQFTCAATHVLTGAATTCNLGVSVLQTCQPRPCAIIAPVNGGMGTCVSPLPSGANCQFTCTPVTHVLTGPATSCLNGLATFQTCVAAPPVLRRARSATRFAQRRRERQTGAAAAALEPAF